MKLIDISTRNMPGMFAMVDDEDFEQLSKKKWTALKDRTNLYARSQPGDVIMHRFILNAKKRSEIDHIDGNGLNNQKYNLRVCSHSENICNSKKRTNIRGKQPSSHYKGVTRTRNGKYSAKIRRHGIDYCLGTYLKEEEAAEAYNFGARKHHGKFAKLNQINNKAK